MSIEAVFTKCGQLIDGIPVEDWCNPGCEGLGKILLQASTVDDTDVSLSWAESVYTAGSFYYVYGGTLQNPSDSGNILGILEPDKFVFLATGLTQNTTYYFEVVKVMPSGQKFNSNIVSATTTLPAEFPPTATLFLCASSISGTEVDLFWIPADPFDPSVNYTYNLYRSTTANFTPGAGNLIASGIVKATTTHNDTGLNPSLIYYYILKQTTSADTILSNYLASSGPVAVTAQKGSVGFVGLASDSLMQLSGSWFTTTLGFHDGTNTVTVDYGQAFAAARNVQIILPQNATFSATLKNNSPTGFQIDISTSKYVKTNNPTKYTFSYGFTVKTN